MEAALRHVAEKNNEALREIEYSGIRGLDGTKIAEVEVAGKTLRIGVVNGLGNAENLIEKLIRGEERLDFVEVMACPYGCIGGAGQPFGYQKIFRCADAGTNHIRPSQGQGCLQQPFADGDWLSTLRFFPDSEPDQQRQGHTGAAGAAQHHTDAGALRVLSGPKQQRKQSDSHGAQLLRYLYQGQGADSVGGGEIAAHHPAEADDREKTGKNF